MKKIIVLLVLSLISLTVNAQINAKAQAMKSKEAGEKINNIYNLIKKEAVIKWKEDNAMIVYEINNQVNAFYTIFIEEKHKYIEKNEKRFKKYCHQWKSDVSGSYDWVMIKYKIDVDEKNADY